MQISKVLYTTFVLSLLSACNTDQVVKNVDEQIMIATTKDSQYVQAVKQGHLENRESISVEEAFQNFFKNPQWKYFLSDDNQHIVEFTGNCLYQEKEVKARLQFIVQENTETFTLHAMDLNDIAQNQLMIAGLLDVVYEKTELAEETPSQKKDLVQAPSSTTETIIQTDELPQFSVKADSYHVEQNTALMPGKEVNAVIETTVVGYVEALASAINQGDFSIVEPYLVPNSNLYEEQQQLVNRLHNKAIEESVSDVQILSIQQVDKVTYKVVTNESIEVITGGDGELKQYTWLYTVKEVDGYLMLSNLTNP